MAIIDWVPAVASVALNEPAPPVSVLSAGNTAWASELVKWMVPVYPEARLLNASRAVTVTVTDVPAVLAAGVLTMKWLAAAGLTSTGRLPVMLLESVSVAVTVCVPAISSVTPFAKTWLPASAGPNV